MKRLVRVAFGASLLIMTGCYKATFIRDPMVQRGEQHDEWESFFLWGLAGHADVDVRKVCSGADVAEVQTSETFLNGLVSGVTLGIYAPRTVSVTCARDGGAR